MRGNNTGLIVTILVVLVFCALGAAVFYFATIDAPTKPVEIVLPDDKFPR